MKILISILILLALISALFVISVNNPIHSVFALIRLFIRSTRLLFTLQADYLRILLLVVYVGAIAVLFLFVIMMLHLNIIHNRYNNNLLRYLPIGIIIAFLFILNFLNISNEWVDSINELNNNFIISYASLSIHSINIFRDTLYSKYYVFFIIRSLILFVAMIGAIVLARESTSINLNKIQNPNKQLLRSR
jgi:NADH-quinone oxidoreductase subunit J